MSLLDGASKVKPFIITVSARALFDMDEANTIYEEKGLDAFRSHQIENAEVPLKPGPVFHLVQKLLKFNENKPEDVRPFEIILLSRNSTETALRILNSIENLDLPLIRAVFTGGEPSSNYVEAIGADLFLSSNPKEVAKVIHDCGIPAATVFQPAPGTALSLDPDLIKIAFDGDAVVFSDEAEQVYGTGGFKAFYEHEKEHASLPLKEGPFKGMLTALFEIQKAFPNGQSPIKTALITARSMPAHMRALNTLTHWGLVLDAAMFLGGRSKAPFLKSFKADLFFDDSRQNIENALTVMSAAGHVPFGVRNAPESTDKSFSGSDEVKVGRLKTLGNDGNVLEFAGKTKKATKESKVTKAPKASR